MTSSDSVSQQTEGENRYMNINLKGRDVTFRIMRVRLYLTKTSEIIFIIYPFFYINNLIDGPDNNVNNLHHQNRADKMCPCSHENLVTFK